MSPEKMIGLSFAAAAAKLYEVLDKLITPSVCADGVCTQFLCTTSPVDLRMLSAGMTPRTHDTG